MKKHLFQSGVFTFMLLISAFCYADYPAECTFTANSCSKADVQSAVEQAINAGGSQVVCIPAGQCTWTGSAIHVSGDVSIVGEGPAATELHTTTGSDFLNYNSSGSSNSWLLPISPL